MRNLISGLGTRRLAVLASAVAVGTLAATGAADASTAAAASPNITAAPSIGVLWYATPNAGDQCGGPTSQWTAAPNWTTPILIDTDSRAGGCQLAFGVYDPSSALAGLSIDYTWQISPGGDGGQCQSPTNGEYQGTFQAPIVPLETFGTTVLDDTDNRSGYCNLTFTVSGLSDIGLDVQFYPTPGGDAGQCNGYLPQGSYRTAYAGSPVTIGLDTDDRSGGCYLSLRIEHFGFGPIQHATATNHVR